MAQQVLAAKSKGLNLTLATQMAERFNSFELFPALHMHGMTDMHSRIPMGYTHTLNESLKLKREMENHSHRVPIPHPKGRVLTQDILEGIESFFKYKALGKIS